MKQDDKNNFDWKKDDAELPDNFDFDDFLKDDQSLDDKDVLDGRDLLNDKNNETPKAAYPRPVTKSSAEAPPRPIVQQAEPRPRIFVTPPDAGYREQKPKGLSERTKWIIAAVAIVAAVVVLAIFLFSGPLSGGGLAKATSTPSATTSATETPAPTQKPTSTPTPTPEATATVTVTAGKGGNISPNGTVSTNEGENVTFTMMPESGYKLSQLLVDGVSVEPTSSYTFTKIYGNHTIYAVFELLPQTPEPTTEPTQEPTPMPTSAQTPVTQPVE
jgi:hypothetical protein